MARIVKHTASSVHQQLLNKAKESARPFNELLQYFAIERFIYRLSRSAHADRFILKGALMFSTWSGLVSRPPTMDIDLLGQIDNSLEVIIAAMKDTCVADVEDDGMSFNARSVTATRIVEDAHYEGVRVRIQGTLGKARVFLQVDVGFGDVIVPGLQKVEYPSILGFASPELNGYTMESTIAEKFQAMVKLGILNSRMKDFYDIWALSRAFNFNGELLAEAIGKTFENRKTPVSAIPAVFQPSFVEDADKQVQWLGFLRKTRLDNCPRTFGEIVTAIKTFLHPPVTALAKRQPFCSTWNAPGPWR